MQEWLWEEWQAAAAFAQMAGARHIGKLALTLHDSEARIVEPRFGDEAAIVERLRALKVALCGFARERGFVGIRADAGAAERGETLAAAHCVAGVDVERADDAGRGERQLRLALVADEAAGADRAGCGERLDGDDLDEGPGRGLGFGFSGGRTARRESKETDAQCKILNYMRFLHDRPVDM